MRLQDICKDSDEFISQGLHNVVFIQDDDGDVFYLYSIDSKSNKIAINSINTELNPFIYGDVDYKIVGSASNSKMRRILIDYFLGKMEITDV